MDYHCHLSPRLIAQDARFGDAAELFLAGDHYKWRAMRSDGVPEECITGPASGWEKFQAWARTVPHTIGNPLYHWTHLELKRYFDIDLLLCPDTAQEIWDACNARLAQADFSVRGLVKRSGVEVLCTTDDPLDTLEFHEQTAQSGFGVKVFPAFRPDKAMNIGADTFLPYMQTMGVSTYAALQNKLLERIAYFHAHGCRIADHALETIPSAAGDASAAFDKAFAGAPLSQQEQDAFQTDILRFFAAAYTRFGWVMQLHIGALRNNNTPMYEQLGPDTGFDSIGDLPIARPLARLLDLLEMEDHLPKTILYTLNPKDNYVLASMLGNFQKAPTAGKLQLGSAWWFGDQKDGMLDQMKALANLGLLRRFVGMLTDSRSFVSFPRHEYFRRILCNLLGEWVQLGECPTDYDLLGGMVQDICYYNAKQYFGF